MALSHPFQAVIFDLDGVLAFTEPVIFDILKKLVRSYGMELHTQDYQALLGLDYADSAAYLVQRYPIPIAQNDLEAQFHAAVLGQIGQKLTPAPGTPALVNALAMSGTALGLASNSPCDYVRAVVQGLKLDRYFSMPVCREDVLNGKPAPDPYLEACRRVSARPSRCLAIEDSRIGLQSAMAAGLECCLVGAEAFETLPLGVHHFETLEDVLKGFEQGYFR